MCAWAGIIMQHFKGIKHDGGHAKKASLLTDCMTFIVSDGMAYNHAADMSGGQDLNGGISRGNWYDAVSGMRQNRIANRRQHLFPGKGKDSWSHMLYPSNLSCLACGKSILLKDAEKQVNKSEFSGIPTLRRFNFLGVLREGGV